MITASFFTDMTRGYEVWRRAPRFANPAVQRPDPPPRHHVEDNEYRDPAETQRIHMVVHRARAIYGEEVAVQSRHMLELLRHDPPTNPISFLPQSSPNEILMYDIAAYVMR